MSRKYKFYDQEKLYFVSFAVINWIDVFTRLIYKDILVDSLRYCQLHKGLEIYAWCIMPSHVHLLIGKGGNHNLEDIMRDLKKFTSVQIQKNISENSQESRREWLLWMFANAGKGNSNNQKTQFWQQNNQPILVKDATMCEKILCYIHENPVKEGFCVMPEHYPYSSALDYSGQKGFLEVLSVYD